MRAASLLHRARIEAARIDCIVEELRLGGVALLDSGHAAFGFDPVHHQAHYIHGERRRGVIERALLDVRAVLQQDRKSTRLNSSHDQISYAVFCLKKKTYRTA